MLKCIFHRTKVSDHLPLDELKAAMAEVMVDAAVPYMPIEIPIEKIRDAALKRATEVIDSEFTPPLNKIAYEMGLSGLENDATREELRQRIMDSVLFSPANALRLARIALHSKPHR
jgi:hypothetical protein